jgi:1-acyl-sn-glycerol-3-phosphate acyltransferase
MKACFYYFNKFFLLPILKILFFEKVLGKENVPKNGNFIIVSNHNSTLDHFLIGIAFQEKLRQIHFLGKRKGLNGILRIPLDWLAETISFDPKKTKREIILKKIETILKMGKILVIYPEGDTNRKKELLRGKTGVAEIFLKTKIPLLPVGILKKGKIKWRVNIGKVISWENFKDLNDLQKITDEIMKKISPLCEKSYPYGD